MEIAILIVTLTVICYSFYKWLSFRRKQVKADISLGMLSGKPFIYCNIGNYFGDKPIIIQDCHLMVDDQFSLLVVDKNMPLPYTVQTRQGIVVSFDPIPLVAKAREKGQDDFKVRALFHDNAGREYLSKSITIETDPRRFIRPFEDALEHLSKPAEKTMEIAKEITEQLNQQLVGIPHIALALIREQNGVGGYVLRELGIDEAFLLNLAIHSCNLPRDHTFPQPYYSSEVQELFRDFMRDEARKMRQRCIGTGHLLLGLTKQKDDEFFAILEHLEIQPRQIRLYTFKVLRKDQYPIDHPTLPPEGIKQFIWAKWYQFTHVLLVICINGIMWLFPDVEF